jgi:hypothetical protein
MLRYAFTIFLSAFLLFQVQPLMGRFALPWFGGGPSIWTTCMLFFQLLLLGGYLYSHVLGTKLSVRSQVVAHVCMMTLSLLFLPIIPAETWKPTPGDSPSVQILLLLLATVGGPYFMLSTTGPLLQKWFSLTSPHKSPYRLYALSNVGSLLALLSYPFVFEPWLLLRQQAAIWTVAYAIFVGLVSWCAIRLWRHPISGGPIDAFGGMSKANDPVVVEKRSPSWVQMTLWLGLSACGSTILLATTNQLCIDVATVPFLWVLPLSIYLLSFILCFDHPRWYDRRIVGILLVVSAPAVCRVLSQDVNAEIADQIIVYSTVLFACCMACHGELVRSRPDPEYLTRFFMFVSAGGALGGLFVAIFATQFFLGYWEYHIGLVACVLLTILAWCSKRVWLNKLVPAFWIWVIAAGGQAAAIGNFVYMPLIALTESSDRGLAFGGYLLLHLLGLILTAALERRVRIVGWVWIGIATLQIVCLGFFLRLYFPQFMTQQIYLAVALGIALPTLFGLAVLWFIERRVDRSQQMILRALLILSISICLIAFWYFKSLERWQIISLASASGGALLVETIVSRIRSTGSKSWGIWFWIPAGALLVLLSLRLIAVVEEDGNGIAQVSRNFYGVLQVNYEEVYDDFGGPSGGRYKLTHGQIIHGFQFTDDDWRHEPTSYYGRESGVGLAIRMSMRQMKPGDQHPLRVGVVGLGTGSIAAYGKAGDTYRFYEINPDVQALSDKYFTYLKDSPAETHVVLGDARITMERELVSNQSQQFDVLAIDAFSSDAIPVHLLTTECSEVYRQHLRPGGILAVHISNRFLDLNPIARGLADHLGWNAFRIDSEEDETIGVYAATWILLTDSEAIAEDKELARLHSPWDASDPKIQWTDDHSGLWQILTF